jgi:hypothetical protein
MICTVHSVDLSFSYLRSAVEASLDIKKVQMEPNTVSITLILLVYSCIPCVMQ